MTYAPDSKSTSARPCPPSSTRTSCKRAKRQMSPSSAQVSFQFQAYMHMLRIGELTVVTGPEGGNVLAPFGEHWLTSFRETKAYEVWESITDPVLFDLCEPRSAFFGC